jgi:hypothetical protein
MMSRRRVSRPCLAMWLLIAIGDAVLLVAGVGIWLVLLGILGLALVAGAVVGAYLIWQGRADALVRRFRRTGA